MIGHLTDWISWSITISSSDSVEVNQFSGMGLFLWRMSQTPRLKSRNSATLEYFFSSDCAR